MANKIDLVSYVAKIEADMSGLNTGLDQADGLVQGKIGGMVNWSKVAIAGMITGVVAGIGVTIKNGIDSFIEFENQMNTVYTLLPDLSESAMSQMEEQVKSLSKEIGILPNELIPALQDAIGSGVPEDNVFSFMELATKGAIAGITDTETVVNTFTSVLNAYRMEVSETERVSDILFKVVDLGKTSMSELSGALSTVVPTASALGVSFEDVGASISLMTSKGVSTSTATVNLRSLLTELSQAGGEVSASFTELAGKTFKDFIAEGNSLADALELVTEIVDRNGWSMNDYFSTVTGGSAALLLGGENLDTFKEHIDDMSNATGTAQTAFETMDGGIGRSIEKIKVNMAGMVLDLGEKLSPAVATATDFILEAMPTVSDIVEATFNIIGDVVSTFVEVVDFLVEAIRQFVSDNEELFNSVAETISTVFDTIKEIVNLFIEAFKVYWDAYGEYVMTYIKIIWDTVSGVFKGALDTIKGILNLFISVFKGDWDGMGKAIGQITDGLWKMIKSLFEGSVNYVRNIMNAAISTLTSIARSIMEGIWNAFKSVWDSITRWIDNSFSSLGRTISNFGRSFYNAGRDIFGELWDGLKGVWSSISSWVSDKVDWISDKLSFWRKSEREMSSSSSSSSSRLYGGYASYDVGSNFVPMDGLAYLHKGEQIIPASMQGQPYQQQGGNTYQSQYDITLKVDGNLDRSILPEVEKMIKRGIEKAQDRKIDEYKKVGITRPIKRI